MTKLVRARVIGLLLTVIALTGAAAARDLSGWRGRKLAKAKATSKATPAAGVKPRPVARKATMPPAPSAPSAPIAGCLTWLRKAKVPFHGGDARPGIAIPVVVDGPIAGVTYRTTSDKATSLVLDCALVYALWLAGPALREEGIHTALYSASYQVRNVRGTSKRSKHSYGLALDVHYFLTDDDEKWSVLDDYESGLGDELDCIGTPSTDAARGLRTLYCRFTLGNIFHLVLGPDDNADHHNHFHLEAPAWGQPAKKLLSRR